MRRFSFDRSKQHRSSGTDLVACENPVDLGYDIPPEKLSILIQAVEYAAQTDLTALSENFPLTEDRAWFTQWPGEHYKFLSGLTKVLTPRLVLDIGTYHGASALAMVNESKRIITYDIHGLSDIGNAYEQLCFDYPTVVQRIGDLSQSDYFDAQITEIESADLILIDGPKDGHFEYIVVPRLLESMKSGSVLVLDDIRFSNMRDLWLQLPRPRIDVGSFAHFSGTGVVFI